MGRGFVVALTALGALAAAGVVQAQPSIPATVYGSASVDGSPPAEGASVRALIDGKDCTQPGSGLVFVDNGAAQYVVHVMHESQEPGCGRTGKMVTFTVGGRPAGQTTVWQAGPRELNLNAGTGQPVAPPTATPTSARPANVAPPPRASAAPATGTPGGVSAAGTAPGSITPLSPPTDDIPLPFGTRPRSAGTAVQPLVADHREAEDGSSLALPVAIVVGCVAIAGGAGGTLLARKKRGRRGG